MLHGENFARKIQNLDLKPRIAVTPRVSAISLAAANPQVLKQPGGMASPLPMPQKVAYDPAKVYNAPVVRRGDQAANQLKKSIEKRNAAYLEMKKKEPTRPSRPNSAASFENCEQVKDPERKSSMSFLEQLKEKKLKEEALLKKKQQELFAKQKV